VVPGAKLVRGQEPVPGAKQIAADHADRHAAWGETDVCTEAVEAWTREVDRDHVAALHAVRDREGFSAGRGAEVDNAFAASRSKQINRKPRRRVLHVQGAARDERLHGVPVARLEFK